LKYKVNQSNIKSGTTQEAAR